MGTSRAVIRLRPLCMLPFDTRDVWGKAKVPLKVTINGYTWRSTVGNRVAFSIWSSMPMRVEAQVKGRGFRDHHT
jgi:hypothetical protein